MPIGIIFALAAEQGCFEDLLADVETIKAPVGTIRTGWLDGRLVTTIVCGIGPDKAAAACEALLLGHRPTHVISAGFCGGLQSQVKRHDIVVADRIFDAGGQPCEIDPRFRAAVQLPAGSVGPLVTVERIVTKSVAKRTLGERTGAWACEMESLAVAEVCRSRDIPFLAVRAVSDPVDEDLPIDLEPLMNAPPSTAGLLGSVVGTLWRRPSSVKDLWRLKEHALVAADRLASFLKQIVVQLPVDERKVEDSGLRVTNDEPRTTN
jgi:adenosylhomocysteine nucleosidase